MRLTRRVGNFPHPSFAFFDVFGRGDYVADVCLIAFGGVPPLTGLDDSLEFRSQDSELELAGLDVLQLASQQE